MDQSGNIIKDTFFITVSDTFKPIINKWPDTLFYSCNITVPTISASDNCSILEFKKLSGPEPGTLFPIGETILKYQAIDNSGNKTIDSFIVRVQNPIEIRLDTSYFSLCSGDTLYQYIHISNKNGGPYSLIYKSDTLNLIRDTSLIYTVTNDPEFRINAFEISSCTQTFQDTIIYPGRLVQLDSIQIFDESALNARDGKLKPFFNAIDSFIVYDANTLERINNTGTDLAAGFYLIKAFRNNCVFEYGPYSIKLITKTNHATPLNVAVYPIPFSNLLHISCNVNEQSNYQILNLSGRIIAQGLLDQELSIETSELQSGIYLLKIGNAYDQKVIKIIKH